MLNHYRRIKLINNFKNSDMYRNEVHSIIPGGAHTYSKGDDQFPLQAPAAIKKGYGAYLWDIDDNKYLDCSMGLTSVSLGHAFPAVVERVSNELLNGVNFQRPSYLELETAKKFLSKISCHDMIKFSKNGSTVTTAAVKLARAYNKKKYIAFPADHPFYSYDDWFIGKSVCNKGVPSEISELSLTYNSKDLSTLESLFKKYPEQISAVISEPDKYYGQSDNYLKELIDLTHKYNALFIQDEMVTGYKVDFPGAISKYNVDPDLATWGKGIANGFSFCALTGKKDIMELGGIVNEGSEKVFLISTTHGGETHSLTAANAVFDIFNNENVIKYNHNIGQVFIEKVQEVITRHDLNYNIELHNCNWFPVIEFKNKSGESSLELKTLAMQEMIKRGVLFQSSFIPCYSHTIEDLDFFAQAFDETLSVYKCAIVSDIKKYLNGPAVKPVFRKNI